MANQKSAGLDEVSRQEGLLLCPEGAATYAAYKTSLEKALFPTVTRLFSIIVQRG